MHYKYSIWKNRLLKHVFHCINTISNLYTLNVAFMVAELLVLKDFVMISVK